MVQRPKDSPRHLTLVNRSARREFAVSDEVDCGVVLTGAEVKAIRAGRASLTGGYAKVLPSGPDRQPELWLLGLSIPGSESGRHKLLVTGRQLTRLIGAGQVKHQTLVVSRGFFSHGYFKVAVGLGRRLNKHDQRQRLREEEMRRTARALQ